MCFNWQHGAAQNIYEEFKGKETSEVRAELSLEKERAKKAYQDAIDYHGSEEKFSYGFFTGRIYGCNLSVSALELILSERGVTDED